MRQAARQVPLRLVLEAPPQEGGDDKAQHSIAEKFQAFVAAVGGLSAAGTATMIGRKRARMGKGFLKDLRWSECVPDCLRQVVGTQRLVSCPGAQLTGRNSRL